MATNSCNAAVNDLLLSSGDARNDASERRISCNPSCVNACALAMAARARVGSLDSRARAAFNLHVNHSQIMSEAVMDLSRNAVALAGDREFLHLHSVFSQSVIDGFQFGGQTLDIVARLFGMHRQQTKRRG